jgi:hypothetical protein
MTLQRNQEGDKHMVDLRIQKARLLINIRAVDFKDPPLPFVLEINEFARGAKNAELNDVPSSVMKFEMIDAIQEKQKYKECLVMTEATYVLD